MQICIANQCLTDFHNRPGFDAVIAMEVVERVTKEKVRNRGIIFIRSLCFGFIILLAGCTSHYNIPRGLTSDNINQKDSIVIVSTGAKEPSFSHSTGLTIRRVGDGKFVRTLPLSQPNLKSHFADHYGFLNVVTLEPGRYFFTLEPLTPFTLVERPSSVIWFQVGESEILYIGEVFLNFLEKGAPGYAQIVVNDRFERDVGIFLENNPSLTTQYIRKKLAGYSQ